MFSDVRLHVMLGRITTTKQIPWSAVHFAKRKVNIQIMYRTIAKKVQFKNDNIAGIYFKTPFKVLTLNIIYFLNHRCNTFGIKTKLL